MPVPKIKPRRSGTLVDRAYLFLKHGILHGEFSEGSFLNEAEILARYGIGRTPFREACNRLHNEQLLEVVPRRGYHVPELSFRGVRDLLETRIVLEGIAAELAALRADPHEVATLEDHYRHAIQVARKPGGLDSFIEANQKFHLQIAYMTHNGEFEALLRGVLERSTRLVYLAAQGSKEVPAEIESLLKPIVDAIRRKDAVAAHEAVVADITRGQLNALGRDVWGAGSGVRRNGFLLEKNKVAR
ncbi:MAG: GntR family transcriptional regulator [Acidobacteriaceae bacterium]|nr:GntR family transcriptional regulator [Acidobacteriaceae bacterium]MBV9780633.1 GntR family transcriptional regulator [Acidobacteriaceae bacterium]